MPRSILFILLAVFVFMLIPPAIIARKRAVLGERPRIHFVQDMDNMHRLEAQQANDLFADGRAMRPLVEGAVARDELRADDAYDRGVSQGNWITSFPEQINVDRALLERGEERFNIYCAPCHGASGYGEGIVHLRASKLVASGTNGTTWVAPKSLFDDDVIEQPVGRIYNTITNGARTMAGYGAQVPTDDRWAIAAWVKALQRSRAGTAADLQGRDASRLPLKPLPDAAQAGGDS